MHDPVPSDLQASIRQAFLLGLARQPVAPPPSLTAVLPPGSEPALALLALAGQRQRFAGPPPVAVDAVPDAARRLHEDPRPILPPGARRALNHLTRSVEKSLAGNVLPIALRRIAAAGCRPHPFDLPELTRHIKSDADKLGLAERAWLALTASDPEDDAAKGLFFDRITAENWTTFPKALRRGFIADLRCNDPAGGRALIESVWKTEPAPVRVALVEALAAGLGPDDGPLLEKAATDRADSVRQAAARLLPRVPTAEGLARRLAEAATCFKRTSGAVGRMMAAFGVSGDGALTFTLPFDMSQKTYDERERLFGGLPLDALARAVGVTPDEMIAALPAYEEHLRGLLLEEAEARDDAAASQCIIRASLLASQAVTGSVVMPLATAASGPLEPGAAAHFLATPAWKSALTSLASMSAAPKDDGRLVFTATLMPREAMPAFIATLDAAPRSASRAATDFADLILALPA
jgi:hypothetical protein